MRLQQRQARETGICPVRRELYSQCFGEFLCYCFTLVNVIYSRVSNLSQSSLFIIRVKAGTAKELKCLHGL